MVGISYFWVQIEEHLLLFGNLHIPLLDDGFHPLLNRLPDDSVKHVHDKLPGESVKIALVRKIRVHLMVLLALCKEILDRESFEVRHGQKLGVFAPDVCTKSQ